ncbi:hypothetical protein SK128_027582 [Halocaridina rubra]|uniref:Triple QxxK/R motif-containing protein n=1 Tax=Halocaridina rubra TaxID=373956 RepID=A0AAN8WCQ1_HALRR
MKFRKSALLNGGPPSVLRRKGTPTSRKYLQNSLTTIEAVVLGLHGTTVRPKLEYATLFWKPYLKEQEWFVDKAKYICPSLSRYLSTIEDNAQIEERTEMGRKDAQTTRLPVDHYRKQIGKQNKKYTNVDVKKIKKQTEMKKKTTRVYKDVKVVVGGFVGTAILVYLVMFVWYSLTSSNGV